MKDERVLTLEFFALILTLLYCFTLATPPVFAAHKSDTEIAKMTADQRVQEYCDEYYHHAFWHDDYIQLLNKYILQDGAKALPAITQIINEFDPTSSHGKSREKDAKAFAAEGLLSQLDGRVIRLRALPEGKSAIDALRRLVQRMLEAHFDTADVAKGETSNRYRYEASELEIKDMEGLNTFDIRIKDTLRIRYKQMLTDKEMLGFANYLISQDPRYPGWSTVENFKDSSDRNEAGNPRQYFLLKDPEPFYRLWLRYKNKDKDE